MKTPKRLTVAIIIAGVIGSLNGYSESKADPGSADLKQLFEQIHKSVTWEMRPKRTNLHRRSFQIRHGFDEHSVIAPTQKRCRR